jgi:hypothetical protein
MLNGALQGPVSREEKFNGNASTLSLRSLKAGLQLSLLKTEVK